MEGKGTEFWENPSLFSTASSFFLSLSRYSLLLEEEEERTATRKYKVSRNKQLKIKNRILIDVKRECIILIQHESIRTIYWVMNGQLVIARQGCPSIWETASSSVLEWMEIRERQSA